MTYDIESRLRAYLRNAGWTEIDIYSAVRRCQTVRVETFAGAKQAAAHWLNDHR